MSNTPNRKRLLLLGGTREARQLAEALSADPNWLITSSLAGITRTPDAIAGDVRTGGFGGSDQSTKRLRANGRVHNVFFSTLACDAEQGQKC